MQTPLPLSTDLAPAAHPLVEPPHARGYDAADHADDAAIGILAARWPTLGRAIGRHQRHTATQFSTMAYQAVEGGIIRHDARQRLAAAAAALSIKPFDAQLLIACSIRQWALDHRFDAAPNPEAPILSPEHRAWSRMWLRFTIFVALALACDAIFLYKWLY